MLHQGTPPAQSDQTYQFVLSFRVSLGTIKYITSYTVKQEFLSDFSTHPKESNKPLVHSCFSDKSTHPTIPQYKGTHPKGLNKPLVHSPLQTFPSYSRNWGLFGRVDPILREACQEVSTISRSKFEVHQTHPTHLIPISPCRYLWVDLGSPKFEAIWVRLGGDIEETRWTTEYQLVR
jgi:hypothetical protein